ncbi:hypothetical protein SNE40_010405 [Patella caerulea]|uniref:Uncharacterized protein n=1 Tax=Patella caerulea TaxID=87958 RepID=A0AAN8JVX8_PATCE
MKILISVWYLFTCCLLVVYGKKKIYIPDEQRVFEKIMTGYENSVRPVINSSHVLVVKFALRLNQIVGLDERHQVLTTNVFIDQEWVDENLIWDPKEYNNIQSLRVPTKSIWLPDTFIYNNVDDGSTGFMQGSYVLIHSDGTVLWPVPVKLKSSCKVDITFFPFDDQICILRFGSWIYSGDWMDFIISNNDTPVDLSYYMKNSEWELLSINQQKNIRRHSCCSETHPDLTFMLHIRRKTFYYIFNIIVPCTMLSILTMLTFWLPPTSGEKITLGLSVFLAFSMFMLLIAEEVPATSEAVPLIGIYLCVVMTMTSVSVIVAVLVINIYNRGMKTRRAPNWLRKLTLVWFSKAISMHHDIELVAKSVNLDLFMFGSLRRPSMMTPRCSLKPETELIVKQNNNSEDYLNDDNTNGGLGTDQKDTNVNTTTVPCRSSYNPSEKVWYRHEELEALKKAEQENGNSSHTGNDKKVTTSSETDATKPLLVENETSKNKLLQLPYSTAEDISLMTDIHKKKVIIAEWQRIAAVVDRVLFIFFLLATIMAYLVLLVILPAQHYTTQKDTLSEAILQNIADDV